MKKEKKFNSKSFKKSIINNLSNYKEGESTNMVKTPRYKTGIIYLDYMLDGGIPKGSIINLGSKAGVGKSTLLIQACGKIIETYDKNVYYINVEGGATIDLFSSMGYNDMLYNPDTNPDGRFYLMNFSTIQDIMSFLRDVSYDPDAAVVVIDSATLVVDQSTLEKDDLGSSNRQKGSKATMWSNNSSAINAIIKGSDISLIMLHQAREDLNGFKARTKSAHGNALKHITTLTLWAEKKESLELDSKIFADEAELSVFYMQLSIEKTRITTRAKSVKLALFEGRGISNVMCMRDWLETNTYFDETDGKDVFYIKKSGPHKKLVVPQLDISFTEKSEIKFMRKLISLKNSLLPFVKEQIYNDYL